MKTYATSYPLTRAISYSPSSARLAGSTGAGMRITNNVLTENSASGTFIGTLSTFGTTGTPVFTLVNSASNKIALSGTNNVTVQAGAANTDYEVTPSYSFIVSVTGVAPVLPNTTFQIVVTDVLEPVAPANTVLPVISGSPYVGQTLACDTGTWTGVPTPTYTYQWKYFGGGNIAGATGSSYVIQPGDSGTQLTCTVTATNGSGNASAVSLPSAGITSGSPSNTVGPSISGALNVGSVLTLDPGIWVGPPTIVLAYQWNTYNTSTSVTTPIPGATTLNYVTQPSDVGLKINCKVTATNSYGSAQNFASLVGPITGAASPPANAGGANLPVISGGLVAGNLLSTTDGTWTGSPAPTFTYQWKNGGANIAGATASSYTTVSGDVGAMISVTVTGTNGSGSASATATAVGPITPSGSGPSLDFSDPDNSGYIPGIL